MLLTSKGGRHLFFRRRTILVKVFVHVYGPLKMYPDLVVIGWLIDSLRPGKHFFSHVGTEPPLPVYY